MPCYVRFRSIQEMLDDNTIRRDDLDYLYDDIAQNSITEDMVNDGYFDGDFIEIDCLLHANDFYHNGWVFYDRWVAEWSPDGITRIQKNKQSNRQYEEPTVTRTITLLSVASKQKQCGLCFYQGFKCYTSECNRRYWKLVASVDN